MYFLNQSQHKNVQIQCCFAVCIDGYLVFVFFVQLVVFETEIKKRVKFISPSPKGVWGCGGAAPLIRNFGCG